MTRDERKQRVLSHVEKIQEARQERHGYLIELETAATQAVKFLEKGVDPKAALVVLQEPLDKLNELDERMEKYMTDTAPELTDHAQVLLGDMLRRLDSNARRPAQEDGAAPIFVQGSNGQVH